ncbi:hypothetical protein POM88_039738 [Heracleum sosnowskyi]|uniref:Uncharacterized protein n=1 Tax=Heracleum sosnowskyi TaxID=360622 RepID=A0AAD8HAM5_9APIA|nr:hypothetical protein POM88_039738 [Heracleum sosnowskyi]
MQEVTTPALEQRIDNVESDNGKESGVNNLCSRGHSCQESERKAKQIERIDKTAMALAEKVEETSKEKIQDSQPSMEVSVHAIEGVVPDTDLQMHDEGKQQEKCPRLKTEIVELSEPFNFLLPTDYVSLVDDDELLRKFFYFDLSSPKILLSPALKFDHSAGPVNHSVVESRYATTTHIQNFSYHSPTNSPNSEIDARKYKNSWDDFLCRRKRNQGNFYNIWRCCIREF